MSATLKKYRSYIVVSAAAVTALGVCVVIGWLADVVSLKSVLPGLDTMKFNSACCFILSGMALLLAIQNTQRARVISGLLAFIVIAMAGLTVLQTLFNFDLGIDQLFFVDSASIASKQLYPGRMSPITSVCFILLGLSLSGINSQKAWLLVTVQYLLHLITLLAFVALLGYMFKVPALYKISIFTSVALHTALAFFAVSIIATLINPTVGVTSLFTGQKMGNLMARKLFWQIGITIILLGYLRIQAYRYAVVSVEFGIAMFAGSFILASLFLIWRAANELNLLEGQKNVVEENLVDTKMQNDIIQKASEQFFTLFSLNPVATAISNVSDGKFKYVNDAFLKLFVLEPTDIIGKTIVEANLLTAEERLAVRAHAEANAMKLKGFEIQVHDGMGKKKNILMSNEAIDMDGELHFILTMLDITARKEAEEGIRALSEFQHIILNGTDYSIISTGTDLVINTFNKGAEELLGYTAYEIIGQTPAAFHDSNEIVARAEQLSKELGVWVAPGPDVFTVKAKKNLSDVHEWTYIRKDGTRLPVELSITTLKNAQGDIAGFLGIAKNITVQKEAAEKLRKYAILESKSKEMEQFAYITSHDLREPVLTIKTYAGFLTKDKGKNFDEDTVTAIQFMERAAVRMEALINSLLDYSRLSKPKQLELTDCNEVMQAVIDDLYTLITNTNAKITVQELPVLRAYPVELKLLFQNLISNAIKFRKKDVAPEIHIAAKQTTGGWQFAVTDNGIGIEPKDKEKVFVIFQRLHNRGVYEGTGIGLAH